MKFVAFLFPIALFLIFLVNKLMSPYTYALIIREDSAIEYAQALFYALASVLSFIVSSTFLRNKMVLHGVLFGALTVGLLFIALEEISWGQRIFNIENPEYFEKHNVQKEISFHNLEAVVPILKYIYILTGAYGAFAWLFVMKYVPQEKKGIGHITDYIVPDWFISSYFFFVFLIYTVFDFTQPYSGGFLLWRDQEPFELILSLGFLLFLVSKHIKLRSYLTTRQSDREKK
jgi:hypothetical protein